MRDEQRESYISPTSPLYLPGQVRDEQRESFNMLWQRACAPSGEASRRKRAEALETLPHRL